MTNTGILDSFGIDETALVGEGIEARVYGLDQGRVLRVYKPSTPVTATELRALQQFYTTLDTSKVSFKVPKVLSVQEIERRWCTIDERIDGQELNQALGHLEGPARQKALLSYIQTAEHVQQLHGPYDFFGELLAEQPLRTQDWPGFIVTKLTSDYQKGKDVMDKAFAGTQKVLDFVQKEVAIVADTKVSKLVHGDYYVLNVLIGGDLHISGVMDFNALALAGDPRMDLAAALIFLIEQDGNTRLEDREFLLNYVIQHYGKDIRRIIQLYTLYFAIHFASFCKPNDPATFNWAMKTIQEQANKL
jgi:aminoglycoside phosphotransferase (APT) family kinase protein